MGRRMAFVRFLNLLGIGHSLFDRADVHHIGISGKRSYIDELRAARRELKPLNGFQRWLLYRHIVREKRRLGRLLRQCHGSLPIHQTEPVQPAATQSNEEVYGIGAF